MNIIEQIYSELATKPTIYATVKRVSRNWVWRDIAFFIVINGKLINISKVLAQALGLNFKEGAVVVKGFGDDMCFHVLYHFYQLQFGCYPPRYELI